MQLIEKERKEKENRERIERRERERRQKLEKNFNAFVEKVNIDEIYRQLKFLDETKADKKDLDDLSEKYNNHQIEIKMKMKLI